MLHHRNPLQIACALVFAVILAACSAPSPSAPPGSPEHPEEKRTTQGSPPLPAGAEPPLRTTVMPSLPSLPRQSRAPELAGLGTWHNSEPLTLERLRGKVVLVDFWTYSCINCIRTLPYIQGYWEKFQEKPFVLIGVHTPEFVFEKLDANVAAAIKRHGLTYPVAQDNDFATWNAFANRYWPAKYLIDAEGYIRYTHFGEGAYEETDLAIQSLLAEIGVAPTMADMPEAEPASTRRAQTPETYLGARSWAALANAEGSPTEEAVTYEAPSSLKLHQYALVGTWKLRDDERQVLQSETGEIRLRFLGSECNLVFGLEDEAASAQAKVTIDGKEGRTFTIGRNDLENLFQGDYGEHELTLQLFGEGVAGYAFTFGAG